MNPVNETGTREYLAANNWPAGIQDTVIKAMAKFPIRFIIVDDSGSMVLHIWISSDTRLDFICNL